MLLVEGGRGFEADRMRRGSGHPGQAKIQNLGMPTPCDKDIGRLDTAMNDAFGMNGVEGIGNFDSRFKNPLQIHRPVPDEVLQGCAIEKFHHDERPAILLTDFVNRTDVGMVQSGGGLRFSLKPGQSL